MALTPEQMHAIARAVSEKKLTPIAELARQSRERRTQAAISSQRQPGTNVSALPQKPRTPSATG